MNFEFSPTSINFGTTLESSPTTGINIRTNTFDINKSVIPITETPKTQTLTINDKDTFSPSFTSEKPLTETLLFNPSTTNTSIFTNTNINTSTNQNIINTINFDDPNITFSVNTDPALEFGTNTFNVDNEWLNNATIIKIDPEFIKSDIISRLIDVNGWQKDLNPSQETIIDTYDLKAEMDLAMDNSFTDYYSSDFSSPSSNTPEQDIQSSSGYTDESSPLSKTDQQIANGKLSSVVSSDETLRNFMKEKGISSEKLAKLILNGDEKELQQYRKETSSHVAWNI
jgi:hypothetical protein